MVSETGESDKSYTAVNIRTTSSVFIPIQQAHSRYLIVCYNAHALDMDIRI